MCAQCEGKKKILNARDSRKIPARQTEREEERGGEEDGESMRARNEARREPADWKKYENNNDSSENVVRETEVRQRPCQYIYWFFFRSDSNHNNHDKLHCSWAPQEFNMATGKRAEGNKSSFCRSMQSHSNRYTCTLYTQILMANAIHMRIMSQCVRTFHTFIFGKKSIRTIAVHGINQVIGLFR